MNRTELALERLELISLALPTLLPEAKQRTTDALTVLGTPKRAYPKLYADNFTATLRSSILDDPIDGWEIRGGSNCLHLLDKETSMKVRFLKEFAFDGVVPPAGHNKARQTAWVQNALLDEPVKGKKPLCDVHIVLGWVEINGVYRCTFYQTLGPGQFPKGAQAKAIMTVPATDDLKNMSFNGDTSEDEHIVPKKNIIIQESRGI